MTNTQNSPLTREQFTANCDALHALINSRVESGNTRAVYCERLQAARESIARMRRYYAANPTSNTAPAILARAQAMEAELNQALSRDKPTPYIAEIIDRLDNNRIIETIYSFETRTDASHYAAKVCNTYYADEKGIVYRVVDRTATATPETGQAAILLLSAIVAIIACLYLCYSAISQLAGTNNLFTAMLGGIAAAIK